MFVPPHLIVIASQSRRMEALILIKKSREGSSGADVGEGVGSGEDSSGGPGIEVGNPSVMEDGESSLVSMVLVAVVSVMISESLVVATSVMISELLVVSVTFPS
jgi:hypothetical protein